MRPALINRYCAALADISALIEAGACPETVAAAVMCLELTIRPAVCRAIEAQATPGTFAEAVFHILAY